MLIFYRRIGISKPFFPARENAKFGPVGERRIKTGKSEASNNLNGHIGPHKGKRSPFDPRSTPTACPRESPCYSCRLLRQGQPETGWVVPWDTSAKALSARGTDSSGLCKEPSCNAVAGTGSGTGPQERGVWCATKDLNLQPQD